MTDMIKEFNEATMELKQQTARSHAFNKGAEAVNLVAMFGKFGLDLTKNQNEF